MIYFCMRIYLAHLNALRTFSLLRIWLAIDRGLYATVIHVITCVCDTYTWYIYVSHIMWYIFVIGDTIGHQSQSNCCSDTVPINEKTRATICATHDFTSICKTKIENILRHDNCTGILKSFTIQLSNFVRFTHRSTISLLTVNSVRLFFQRFLNGRKLNARTNIITQAN